MTRCTVVDPHKAGGWVVAHRAIGVRRRIQPSQLRACVVVQPCHHHLQARSSEGANSPPVCRSGCGGFGASGGERRRLLVAGHIESVEGVGALQAQAIERRPQLAPSDVERQGLATVLAAAVALLLVVDGSATDVAGPSASSPPRPSRRSLALVRLRRSSGRARWRTLA